MYNFCARVLVKNTHNYIYVLFSNIITLLYRKVEEIEGGESGIMLLPPLHNH